MASTATKPTQLAQPSLSSTSSPSPLPPDLSARLPKLTPRRRAPPVTNPTPVPEAPPLPRPPPRNDLNFIHPTRRIISTQDHELFLKSPSYTLLLSFVFSLTDAVKDCPASAVKEDELSPVVRTVLKILDGVEEVVKRCPAEDQGGSRFGNKGFRAFLDAMRQEYDRWHGELGIVGEAAVDEVSTYFSQSFGNRTRIDYGSGHELNFVVWLLCLYQLEFIGPADFRAVVLKIFTRYLTLMRLIQSTYYLEPAGSHGVWGLDDYQFLPFLFGAAQLVHHPYIRPRSIHQTLILEQHAPDYLYLDQVAFINSIKNVEGLRWHSPMLDDISAAKSWEKVEAGMRRMFVAEVLRKLPVMQHFLFGALVPAVDGMSGAGVGGDASSDARHAGHDHDEDADDDGVVMRDGMKHVHQTNSWGDCCGIKVPSSIGAAQEMKKKQQRQQQGGNGVETLRRLPFD